MTARGLHGRRMHGRGVSLLGRLFALPVALLVLLGLGVTAQHGHAADGAPDGARVCTVCHLATEAAEVTTASATVSAPDPVAWVEPDPATPSLPSGETRLATARAPPLDV